MKKIISFILTLTMLLGMAGCAKSERANKDDGTTEIENKQKKEVFADYLLAKSVYPQMAQYPDEEKYQDKSDNGVFDNAKYEADFSAWRKSKEQQRNQPEGYADGLGKFISASSKELLCGSDSENLIYSPINVFMALGMLAEITDNNSRQQILNLIGVDNIENLRAKAKSIWNANYCDDGRLKSVLASSMWLNENVNFKQNTIQSLADNYFASSFKGEMGSPKYDKAIQSWLDEQTNGLLNEQSKSVKFDSQTVIALATTIFYRASWDNKFTKEATDKKVFHGAKGDTECEFMNQSGKVEDFYYGDNFTAISQSLAESGSMWFIKPNDGSSVDDILSGDALASFFNGGKLAESEKAMINKSIPKFDATSDIDLCEKLKALGMTDIFDETKSDFSPLTDNSNRIILSSANHAARVKIDEDGCTATAFTVLICDTTGMIEAKEVDFVLDKPFIFVITSSDGLPLFIGVVNNCSSM